MKPTLARFTALLLLAPQAGLHAANAQSRSIGTKPKAMKALLDAHNAELKKNVRPAGLVQNQKPILPHSTGIPTLAELRK